MKNIAVLEISNGHVETLFAKTANYNVHLLCNTTHKERVKDFDTVENFYFINPKESQLQNFLSIRKYLRENKINTIVINTASWSVIRYLPFLLTGVKVIGVIHGIEKLQKSFSQKILSLKIQKYFVLSKHLFTQLQDYNKLSFSYFYPMFFPKFQLLKLEKKEEFWIIIPGQLEYKLG